jgi:hypothetical protein
MQRITPFLWFDGKVEEAMNCASDRFTADIGRSYGSSSTPKNRGRGRRGGMDGQHESRGPDESMILALRGAAGRGVKVTEIVPEKVDSFLTRYASRSYYDDLLDIGVDIQLYRGGLLHTKSICVDRAM